MDYKLSNHDAVIDKLNQILGHELSGVVRYTHYSFMVFGYSRIPVTEWFRSAADETLRHATEAGEMITFFGEHPGLGIGDLLESHKHDMRDILMEAMEFELQGVDMYRELLALVEQEDAIFVVEYARQKIAEESQHIGEIDKMLRQPGDIARAVQT
ncbi:MAG: ferritin-like domain-containing protein [Pseudomonadales bacterium]